jgi:DNA-binding MarR family transcriptional regulator
VPTAIGAGSLAADGPEAGALDTANQDADSPEAGVLDTASQDADSPEAGSQNGTAAELLAAISAVRRTARRAVRQRWHAEPLPMAHSELLRLVAAQPGISVAEAAGELRLAPNTVSTLVGRLVTDGLLTRGRVLADGRAVRLSVTAKARQRLASYRDLRAEITQQAMARMAPADIEALAGAAPALLRLAGQLGQP